MELNLHNYLGGASKLADLREPRHVVEAAARAMWAVKHDPRVKYEVERIMKADETPSTNLEMELSEQMGKLLLEIPGQENARFISEEHPGQLIEGEDTWASDTIDGTWSYLDEAGMRYTSVLSEHKGVEEVRGVIVHPPTGQVWQAYEGQVTVSNFRDHFDPQPFTAQATSARNTSFINVHARNSLDEVVDALKGGLKDDPSIRMWVRREGSPALAIMEALKGAGAYVANWTVPTDPWDLSAPLLATEWAGGAHNVTSRIHQGWVVVAHCIELRDKLLTRLTKLGA